MGTRQSKRTSYRKVPISKELILSPAIPSKFTKDENGECKINKGPYQDRELLELIYYLMPEYRDPVIFDRDTVNEFSKLLCDLLDLKCEHRDLRILRFACVFSIIVCNTWVFKTCPEFKENVWVRMVMYGIAGDQDEWEFSKLYLPLCNEDVKGKGPE